LRFDTTSNDRAYYSSQSPIFITGLIAGPILVATGIFSLTFALTIDPGDLRNRTLLAAFGAFLIALGCIMTEEMWRARRERLRFIDIDPDGVTLHFTTGKSQSTRWNGPKFKMFLLDYRRSGANRMAAIPCAAGSRYRLYGTPPEVHDRLIAEAHSMGLSIGQRESHGIRVTTLGASKIE
jgi:hypothetical protein